MKRFLFLLSSLMAMVLAPLAAPAYPIAVQHVYVNGDVLTPSILNPNISTIVTWANGGVEAVNIGPLGIYASNIKPTSATQATLGGTWGYTVTDTTAGQVTLTVAAPTGQTADIADFTLAGAVKFFIDSAGGAHGTTLALTTPLAIGSGGTGSAAQNFVDLTTAQTVGGAKTFTAALTGTSAAFSSALSATTITGSGVASVGSLVTTTAVAGSFSAAGFTGGTLTAGVVADATSGVGDMGLVNAYTNGGFSFYQWNGSAYVKTVGISGTGALTGATIINGNALALNGAIPGGSNGDISFGRTGGTAYAFMGTALATGGQFDFGSTNAGAYTFQKNPSSPILAPIFAGGGTFASDVTLLGTSNVVFNSAALGGQIRGDGISNLILRGGTAGSVYIQNNAGAQNNAHFPDPGGLILDRGGLTSTAPAQAASDGATRAYVPPVYDVNGAALASTTHIVTGSITGNSVATNFTPTIASAAIFSSATSYAVFIQNPTSLNPVVTITSGSQFNIGFGVAPGNGVKYYYVAIGY